MAAGLIAVTLARMVSDISRRRVSRLLVAVIAVDIAYWVAWYADRSLVASNTRTAYYEFENAFPLADAWLAVCCLGAILGLRARSGLALLWLLMAGGVAALLLRWTWSNRAELLAGT